MCRVRKKGKEIRTRACNRRGLTNYLVRNTFRNHIKKFVTGLTPKAADLNATDNVTGQSYLTSWGNLRDPSGDRIQKVRTKKPFTLKSSLSSVKWQLGSEGKLEKNRIFLVRKKRRGNNCVIFLRRTKIKIRRKREKKETITEKKNKIFFCHLNQCLCSEINSTSFFVLCCITSLSKIIQQKRWKNQGKTKIYKAQW